MPDYRQMYFHLMGAISDALEALGHGQSGQAEQILINAQLWTEEIYISSSDEDE